MKPYSVYSILDCSSLRSLFLAAMLAFFRSQAHDFWQLRSLERSAETMSTFWRRWLGESSKA